MPKYEYRARTQDGRLTRGLLRAASSDRAGALLRSHGLTPIEVKESDADSLLNRQFGSPIGMKDLILFSRQISSMIEAGVPVLESLKALRKQVSRAKYQEILQDMIYGVEGGESLSVAMTKHPKVFSNFFLGVVRTGEASGRLSGSLAALAEHIEQDYTFVRKVRSALLYPVFVLAVVVILAIVMVTFVLPQLTVLFADAGVNLPWPTRVLLGITNFFRDFWLLVLLAAVALGFLLRSYIKTPEGRYALSTYVLRIPLLKTLFQKIYLARLTSILNTLFESDVPIIESLALARDSIGNKVYQRILNDTTQAVKDGSSISSVWEREYFIPPLLTTMVSVGEKSGEVSDSFKQAHAFFKRDVETILDSITVLLEPILIIVLGIGVAIVVAAVLLPIYNLVLVL